MFKSENGETIQRVNFHQDALYLKVNDSDELVSDCSFDWKAGSQSITVTSNVLWEANFVDGNVEDAFSKGLNEGEKFGKPGELVTLRFDLNANDHNFSADSNKVKLMIVPVKVKVEKVVAAPKTDETPKPVVLVSNSVETSKSVEASKPTVAPKLTVTKYPKKNYHIIDILL